MELLSKANAFRASVKQKKSTLDVLHSAQTRLEDEIKNI